MNVFMMSLFAGGVLPAATMIYVYTLTPRKWSIKARTAVMAVVGGSLGLLLARELVSVIIVGHLWWF